MKIHEIHEIRQIHEIHEIRQIRNQICLNFRAKNWYLESSILVRKFK